MTVVVDGSGGITTNSGTVVSTTDATLNGLTVGKGGGAVSTNTAVGASALAGNSTGSGVTALGYNALNASTANRNTAVGWNAASLTTSGTVTAVGAYVLYNNSTGVSNTAVGGNDNVTSAALQSNTTGSYNVGIGIGALQGNTTASNNTAVGYQAGYAQTTGGSYAGYSTYLGHTAGLAATGAANTLIGQQDGSTITSGEKNTLVGRYNGNQNGLDIRTASGYIVLSDGDGNPRFYHSGSNWTIPSGPLLVPYIYATTGAGAGTVVVGTDGNLFRSSSSARYKKDIVDARYGLSDLLKLRAVNYKGNGEQDTDKLLGGLIAEEVDEAGLQEFVIYDDQQRPDALHYAQMVSLCVKSIQELKTIVDAQAAKIAELKAKVGL